MKKQLAFQPYTSLRRKIIRQVNSDLASLEHATVHEAQNRDDCSFSQTVFSNESFPHQADAPLTDLAVSLPVMEYPSDDLTSTAGDPVFGQSQEDFDDSNMYPTYSDSDSSDNSSCDFLEGGDILEKLQLWGSKFNITNIAMTHLLKILSMYFPQLPKDSRTLLKTPKLASVRKMGPGEYCHKGLGNGLKSLVQRNFVPENNAFVLQFNIDGLPLFRSSSRALWPILGMAINLPDKVPFVIGLYCGTEKPPVAAEYLEEFVTETQHILSDGLIIDTQTFTISIHSFVCDAPARAFIKGIKSHSGYNSCEKCVQKGMYEKNKVIFPSVGAPVRTDETFRAMTDGDHHTETVCPLHKLNIGCVSQFGLDYMHLVCLGVMRRFLLYWKGPVGPLSVRLGSRQIVDISNKLLHFATYFPTEFARKPRSISELLRWKATEFRQFLLYLGPVALIGILESSLYDHFLLLSVAIRLLMKPAVENEVLIYAKNLLSLFVQQCEMLYGRESLVYNVHNLIHLAGDVANLGPLDNFSAFPFENALGQLKKLIRKPQHPIQQVLNRLSEQKQASNQIRPVTCTAFMVKYQHYDNFVPAEYSTHSQYKYLFINNSSFHIFKKGNNCVLTSDGPAFISNVLVSGQEEVKIHCKLFLQATDLFLKPLPSSNLNIFKININTFRYCIFPSSKIVCKCVCLPIDCSELNFAVFPMLHCS